MINKRTLLIMLACMAALFGIQLIVNSIFPPIPKKPAPVTTNITTEAAVPEIVEPTYLLPEEPEEPAPSALEEVVSLKNDFVIIEFTSWGGGIRSIELRKHKANGYGNAVLNGPGLMPALSVAGASNEVFSIQVPDSNTVVMRSAAGVTKTFSLSHEYFLTGSVKVPASTGSVSLVVGTVGPTQPQEPPTYSVVDWQGASKFRNRTLPRVEDRVKEGRPHEEIQAGWVAVKNQYFAMVLTPVTNVTGVGYAIVNLKPGPPRVDGVMATADIPVTPDFEGGGICEFTFFAGPKDYEKLVTLGKHQEELMDFGTPMDFYSGFFGVVLVRCLGFFYKLMPSYGVAIVLVTIALKVIFWPIQAKSIKSMKEMQKFQPLMAKVREKFKDDPQRMNQELWKLQREHGINPAAGCLPMVVQLPVLIAFYRVLISDIALRGATFLWIKDLSQPDTIATVFGLPINPLPLLMVATMILQQRMTPATGDAAQQKMMMFMPLMMLLFFYKTAAGLTLYWTFQQVLSIFQQWHGMRQEKKTVPIPIAGAGKPK